MIVSPTSGDLLFSDNYLFLLSYLRNLAILATYGSIHGDICNLCVKSFAIYESKKFVTI